MVTWAQHIGYGNYKFATETLKNIKRERKDIYVRSIGVSLVQVLCGLKTL